MPRQKCSAKSLGETAPMCVTSELKSSALATTFSCLKVMKIWAECLACNHETSSAGSIADCSNGEVGARVISPDSDNAVPAYGVRFARASGTHQPKSNSRATAARAAAQACLKGLRLATHRARRWFQESTVAGSISSKPSSPMLSMMSVWVAKYRSKGRCCSISSATVPVALKPFAASSNKGHNNSSPTSFTRSTTGHLAPSASSTKRRLANCSWSPRYGRGQVPDGGRSLSSNGSKGGMSLPLKASSTMGTTTCKHSKFSEKTSCPIGCRSNFITASPSGSISRTRPRSPIANFTGWSLSVVNGLATMTTAFSRTVLLAPCFSRTAVSSST
mmetsp:Transcript_79452/g.230687  ORF Transcript_79452/g.230687 Transcript_79452/m.230687 type:complete len:332 (+) Transcript_79452:771-1766(+)